MTTVFLTHAPADRALAEQMIRGLSASGLDAWSAADAPGIDWGRELERQLPQLGAVVVLWTAASEKDPAVRDAARAALKAGKLVNAVAGIEMPPFPFASLLATPLASWAGDIHHIAWVRLISTIEAQSATPTARPAATANGTVYQPTATRPAASGGVKFKPAAAAVMSFATPKPNPVTGALRTIVAMGLGACACVAAFDIYEKIATGQPQAVGVEYAAVIGLVAVAGMIWKL